MVKMLAISWSMGDIIPLLSPEFFSVNFFYDFRLKCIFLRLMANFLVFDSFNGYRLTSSRLCQCNSKIFLDEHIWRCTAANWKEDYRSDLGRLWSVDKYPRTHLNVRCLERFLQKDISLFFHHLSA